MFERISIFATKYLSAFRLPKVGILDIIEMLILAFLLYRIMVWMKSTRAWAVVKGLAVVLVFMAVAVFLNMTTIIWIAKSIVTFMAVAIVVALQPEIRRLIEDLGRTNFLTAVINFEKKQDEGRFSDDTLNEIISASFEMGRARTGALIVIEQDTPLDDYERTGIAVDGLVTSQLLINIFEHNTPLHDGAVIIRGDRISAATCYLPLSDARTISKELGTRHRAGIGISEATDSVTVIVSEETGRVSVAKGGELYRSLDVTGLRKQLAMAQGKPEVKVAPKRRRRKKEENNEGQITEKP